MTPNTAAELPATLPSDVQGQVIRICMELGAAGPMVMVMGFAQRLDEARLARAARLMLDAEPVLGCRFDAVPKRPAWRRRDDLDSQSWCVVHAVDDPEAAIRAVLTPRPEHLDQTFLVHLVRHPGGDTVLMWINHVIADGHAMRAVAERLAALYSRLADDPDHRPEPNLAPREGDSWMDDLTWRDVLRIVRRDLGDALRARGPAHGFARDYKAFRASPPNGAAYVEHRIAPAAVAAIDRAAAASACTRNDLLFTAFLRAFADFSGRKSGVKTRVGLTVDLRRYAPPTRKRASCSMVGIGYVSVGPDLGAGFDDTLAMVTADLRRQRKGLMGAANPLFVRFLARLPFHRQRTMIEGIVRRTMRRPMPPTFTNNGRFDAAKLRFDGVSPDTLRVVVYPAPLPMVVVSAFEYAGAITLTLCYQPQDLPAERIRALLEQVEREMPLADMPAPAAVNTAAV